MEPLDRMTLPEAPFSPDRRAPGWAVSSHAGLWDPSPVPPLPLARLPGWRASLDRPLDSLGLGHQARGGTSLHGLPGLFRPASGTIMFYPWSPPAHRPETKLNQVSRAHFLFREGNGAEKEANRQDNESNG